MCQIYDIDLRCFIGSQMVPLVYLFKEIMLLECIH